MRMDDAWMEGWGKDGAPMDQPAPNAHTGCGARVSFARCRDRASCQEVAALRGPSFLGRRCAFLPRRVVALRGPSFLGGRGSRSAFCLAKGSCTLRLCRTRKVKATPPARLGSESPFVEPVPQPTPLLSERGHPPPGHNGRVRPPCLADPALARFAAL
jgi:hypothetical protein